MKPEEISKVILEVLARIVPEADPKSIKTNTEFRDQLDIDSMDFLNFVLALHERLGVDIPEADYSQLSTLDRAVQYPRRESTQVTHSRLGPAADFSALLGKMAQSFDQPR